MADKSGKTMGTCHQEQSSLGLFVLRHRLNTRGDERGQLARVCWASRSSSNHRDSTGPRMQPLLWCNCRNLRPAICSVIAAVLGHFPRGKEICEWGQSRSSSSVVEAMEKIGRVIEHQSMARGLGLSQFGNRPCLELSPLLPRNFLAR